jgi:hypothetical protein
VKQKIIEEKSEEVRAMDLIKVELEEVEKRWGEVLLAVKPYNHSVEAFLRAARPKKCTSKGLVIEVFYKFHKEKLEEAKNRQIVEIGLEKVFGGRVSFECVLAEGGAKKEVPLKIEDNQKSKVVTEAEIYDVAKDIFG